VTAVLVVREGPQAGQRIELDRELVVGREGEGLAIDDAELSRRHAAFRPQGDGAEVEDLGSLNGTFVNGNRIQAATRLSAGDSIKLGQSVFALEGVRAAATVASPVPAAAVAVAAVPVGIAPHEPFGTYAAPAAAKHRGGIASRQLLPILLSWGIVVATAIALTIYFAKH
jgi:hypothetical protein